MIGNRIKKYRIAAGLSLRKLAEKTDHYITAQAINKYENGRATPSSKVLSKLAQSLGVSIESFYRKPETEVRLTKQTYRKRSKAKKSILKGLSARVQNHLEKSIEIENLFPEERFKKFKMPDDDKRILTQINEIELFAKWLREEWNLGFDPIYSLANVLEDRGIKVIMVNESEDIDGFFTWANDSFPVIVVNIKFPTDRLRFSIAHELGHLLIHNSSSYGSEYFSNRFAGAFLVPDEVAIMELGLKRKSLNWKELIFLRLKYGLSVQAWIHRAQELEIISENYAATLFRFLRKNKLYDKELGTPLPNENNSRFEFLVLQAIEEGLLSLDRAAEMVDMTIDDFRNNILIHRF